MENNRICLKVHAVSPARGCVIRINGAAEKKLSELQRETGLSRSYIASQMIIQGSDMVDVVVVTGGADDADA